MKAITYSAAWESLASTMQSVCDNLSGYGSRRITDEHRLVYKVAGDELWIAQARYHY